MSMTKKDLRMQKLLMESGRKDLVNTYGNAHNRFSRRDFMSSGLVSLTASFLPVPLMQLITDKAHAAEALDCPKDPREFPIFVNIQLNGGPALFAQHVASGSKGAGLGTGYVKMAMGNPRRVAYFANQAPFWITEDSQQQSGMMRGLFYHLPRPDLTVTQDDPLTEVQIPQRPLLDNINKQIHDNTSFVAVACESIDDSFNNPIDLSGVLAAAGIVGNSLPHLLTGVGAFQSESLSETPIVQGSGCILPPAPMTTVFTRAPALAENFLKNSVKLTGALETLTNSEPDKLVAAINELSDIQLRGLANNPNSTESRENLRRLLRCASNQNIATIAAGGYYNIYEDSYPHNNESISDKRASTAPKDIWIRNKNDTDHTTSLMRARGLTAANMNLQLSRIGTVVSACANRLGHACTINLGGYDYHMSLYDRNDADFKDRFFGDIVGRCLRTARAFNRKMFIYVTADGSVANAGQTASSDWTGEFFKRGMHYIFAYNPPSVGAPPATEGLNMGEGNIDARWQLNQFSETQQVVKTSNIISTAHPIGNVASQDLCGAAVFLNYLNHAGYPEIIDKPALAKLKKRLVDATPSQFSIQQYYTRIKVS